MNQRDSRLILILLVGVLLVGALISAAEQYLPQVASAASSPIFGNFGGIGSFLRNLFHLSTTTEIRQSTAPYQPAADYEQAVIDAVKNVSPAVVSISISKRIPVYQNCSSYNPLNDLPPEIRQFFGNNFPPDFYTNCQNGSRVAEIGGGSGFIVSPDGLIVTNKHVVADTAATYTVYTNDGKKYPATVLARDPIQDLALVKIKATGLPVVTLGDSDQLELGQTAIAIGNALAEFRNTVSVGVISGLGRSITAQSDFTQSAETITGAIQTDAAINPGNSGGPLVNLRGEVIGINAAIVSGAQNIGFALPVNWVKHDIQTVLAGKELQAPYLGVRYTMLAPDTPEAASSGTDYGALIKSASGEPGVVPGSPAAKAGLKDGDVILAVNGKSLQNGDLLQALASESPGDQITLTVQRGKQTLQVDVTLSTRPAGS